MSFYNEEKLSRNSRLKKLIVRNKDEKKIDRYQNTRESSGLNFYGFCELLEAVTTSSSRRVSAQKVLKLISDEIDKWEKETIELLQKHDAQAPRRGLGSRLLGGWRNMWYGRNNERNPEYWRNRYGDQMGVEESVLNEIEAVFLEFEQNFDNYLLVEMDGSGTYWVDRSVNNGTQATAQAGQAQAGQAAAVPAARRSRRKATTVNAGQVTQAASAPAARSRRKATTATNNATPPNNAPSNAATPANNAATPANQANNNASSNNANQANQPPKLKIFALVRNAASSLKSKIQQILLPLQAQAQVNP